MTSRKQQRRRGHQRKSVVLGLDFGATNLKALLLDTNGQVYGRFLSPSESSEGPDVSIRRIIALIERAKRRALHANLELIGVGIGVCAPLSSNRDEIITSPVLPGWRNVPIGSILSDASGLPISVENDANLAILGEWWQGSARNCAVVAGVTLGTGVGGGFVIDGSIYRGASGFGAEFGHIRVARGPRCPCGGRGCLGVVASGTATVLRYKRIAVDRTQSVNSIRDLCRLLKRGDLAAEQAIQVSARYLADACLMLVNSLNPHVFVLAGGMAALANRLVNPIRAHIRSAAFRGVSDDTPVRAAVLGTYSGCFGAGYMAFNGGSHLPR